MRFMNEHDIHENVRRHRNHAVLGPATKFLNAYREEVNAHSDGWPYWAPPVRAANKLMELIERGQATRAELIKALVPIKAFMTRRGNAAGMTLPKIELPKEGA